MGVLELATADEPEVRQSIRARLYLLMHDPSVAPLELDGVRRALAEDFVIEAVPILGDVAAVMLDYAFMRRVDEAAPPGVSGAVAEAGRQGSRHSSG